MTRPARWIPFAAVAVVVLGSTGCGDDTGPTSDVAAQLEGRAFLSENVEGHTMAPGTRFRIEFVDGRISAHAGCNTMGGQFTIAGGRLAVEGDMSSTMMGCEPPLMEQDDRLREFLQGRPRLSLDGDRLVLSTDEVTLEMLDREVADPDVPLEGTVWTVDTIVDGDAASSAPAGPSVTLLVREDGTLVVTAEGCGAIEVAVDMDAASGVMDVGPVPADAVDCPPPWNETLEALRVGTVGYEIVAKRLTLSAGDVGVAATAP